MDRLGRDTPSDNGRDTPKEIGEVRVDTPGPLPNFIYTRDKLLDLEHSPASKIKPACLSDEHFTLDGLWDPERWFRSFDSSRNNSPLTVGDRKKDTERDYMIKRRPSDPKERIKEEKDGIVLSPQRRSFGTGCHVTQLPLSRQISCPSDFKDSSDRDRDRGSRRIGSGRIQLDRDRVERGERDIRAIRDRFDRDDRRFDRERGFGRRDFDDRGRGDFSRHYNSARQRRDSYRNHNDDEEPEWFTNGPTSQMDTMELHGFEEQKAAAKKKHVSEEIKEVSTPNVVEEDMETDESNTEAKDISGVAGVVDRNGSLETNEASSPEESNHSDSTRNTSPPANIFDFNEFFKIDNLPGLNQDGPSPSADIPVLQSRFSQWFANKPRGSRGNSRENSRRSSLNDDFGYLNDLLGGSRSPVIPSPPPPTANSILDQSVFSVNNSTFGDKPQHHSIDLTGKPPSAIAPMLNAIFQNHEKSPSSSKLNFSTQDAEAQLKALLFGRKDSTPSSSGTASPSVNSPLNLPGKIKTVAELEADMKPQGGPNLPTRCFTPPQQPVPPPQQMYKPMPQQHEPQNIPSHVVNTRVDSPKSNQDEGDLTAFNKLLSLMKAGAAAAVESPKMVVGRGENRPITPPAPPQQPPVSSQVISNQAAAAAAQNEFLQALQRNKEQQLQIRQQAINQMQSYRIQQGKQQTPQQMSQPLGTSQRLPVPQGDPIVNFIKQNPTIITKAASPTPPPQTQPPTQAPPVPIMGVLQSTSTPRAPSPSAQLMQQSLLPQAPSSPRVPSPIMFGQQPPMHLSAPSPIHPTQLANTSPMTVSAATTLTSTSTIRPPVIPRVPSPQELIAHTQAIMQTALLKKQLEDQKERFIRKQQERAKSPLPNTPISCKTTNHPLVSSTPLPSVTAGQTQSKPSVTAAFTPTSVIRKMHCDKATEKEKQRQDGMEDMSSPAPKAPIKQLILGDGTVNTSDSTADEDNPNSNGTNSSIPHDMPTTLAEQLSQLSTSSAQQKLSARALVAQKILQNSSAGQTTPVQSAPTPGRPIVKGIVVTGSTSLPSNTQTPTVTRPLVGTTPQTSRSLEQTHIPTPQVSQQHRAIIGVGGVPTSIQGVTMPTPTIPQRQFNISPNPLNRPIPGTPVAANTGVPYGIPITGRIPVQQAIPPIMMQQMMTGISPTAARVTAMNQLNTLNHVNQMNQLALHQQRIVDPRLQGTIRGVYPAISPRSSVTTGMPVGTSLGVNVAISRALSPQAPTQKALINGPVSPGIPMHSAIPGLLNGNNNISKPGDPHLAKWFGTDVLKTQLPHMPPLPAQGQRVMTLEEIERCQQAVTN